MVTVGTTKTAGSLYAPRSSPPSLHHHSSSSMPRRGRRPPHQQRRRCSLLAVVGSATAYLAFYGLILVHKIGVDDSVRRSHAGRSRHEQHHLLMASPSTRDGGNANANANANAAHRTTGLRKNRPVTAPGARNNKRNSKSKYAYSYLLAGCDPNHPWRYKAYLLGVAVSIHALQSQNSQADFHVYVELLHNSNYTTLRPDEEALLTQLGAILHYIPPDPQQSFYRSQLFKFLVLNLTDYNRVLYLDSDVLPLSNLDYLMEAVDAGVLRRNVVFMGKNEPANGGSFVVSPRDGALELAHQLIQRKEHRYSTIAWNETIGWGVDATTVSQFAFQTSLGRQWKSWNFFGADGDQGFLYYWIKFVERDVTFVSNRGNLWHWGSSTSKEGDVELAQPYDSSHLPPDVITADSDPSMLPVLLGSSTSAEADLVAAGIELPTAICFDANKFCFGLQRPRRDFFHFTGDRKPWLMGLPNDYGPDTRHASIDHYWFSLLEELNDRHQLGLDFEQQGGPLAQLLQIESSVEATANGASSSLSTYEIRYKQKMGPKQVYTRLIRDDEPGKRPVHLQATGSQTQMATKPKKKNAYSFLIGACDPDRPDKYRYFLYSVMVIVQILQSAGSTADFHVWIEMFHKSTHDRLPSVEERVLQEMNVSVHYIGGKRPGQSFYGLQLQKFRILGLVQYQHVMYLDSDIIPVMNLDFLFDWIDEGLLKSHVGFVGNFEPMNGGTFVLSPREGAVEQINELIYQKEHRPWSPTVGWGHEMLSPDRYLTNAAGPQTTWEFHGGDTDQGLLYYWTKYVEKDVSMILKNFTVEHWSASTVSSPQVDDPVRTADYEVSYAGRLPPKIPACGSARKWCGDDSRSLTAFLHLTGKAKSQRKPWQRGLPADYSDATKHDSVYHFWFSVLDEVNVQHRLGIDLKQAFGSKLPESSSILEGYNDAFKQKRVDVYTSIID